MHIVLFEPEIPNNTGNIGRLSLATGCDLHLVKPFGFEITDARLKRAGLDYWKHVNVHYYENIQEFLTTHQDKKMAFFSARTNKSYLELPYEEVLFLIFGKESVGFSEEIAETFKNQSYKIPLYSEHIRSLNLANAVSIVVYEGLRQLNQ